MLKRHIESFAKYAGLATVLIEWSALVLFYVIRPEDFNGTNTVSHFASLPETRVVFGVCISLAALFFWIFARFHLPKYYKTPVRIFALSMIAYAALGLVPFDPNDVLSDMVHRLLAMFFSVTFLAGIYMMSKKNSDAQVRVVSRFVVGTATVVLATFIAVSFTKDNQATLLLEVLTALLCQAWMVWISFHSFKVARHAH